MNSMDVDALEHRLAVAEDALDKIYEIVKTYDSGPTVSVRVLEILERLP
jgi:hypothetical protein